ncbi:MAG: GAF domain-containing protein [Anaerolineaceae bacterium]|nr:GAF domain-containing protein [Anaerolineaceae bacterium]
MIKKKPILINVLIVIGYGLFLGIFFSLLLSGKQFLYFLLISATPIFLIVFVIPKKVIWILLGEYLLTALSLYFLHPLNKSIVFWVYLLIVLGVVVLADLFRRIVFRNYQLLNDLQKSQRKFQNMALNSPDIIMVIDVPAGQIIYINREQFQGYSLNQILDSGHFKTIIIPEDWPLVLMNWKKVIQGEIPAPFDCRVQISGKRLEWLEVRFSIQSKGEDRNPNQVLVTLRQITDKKIKQEQDLFQRDLTKVLINQIPYIVLVKEVTGKLIMVNEALANLHGLPQEAFEGKYDKDFEADQDLVLDWRVSDRQVVETRKPVTVEEIHTLSNGQIRNVTSHKVPLIQPDGKVHILVASMDITEHLESIQAERLARKKVEFINEIGAKLASELDFNELLDKILALYEQAIPYEVGHVIMIEDEIARVVRERRLDRGSQTYQEGSQDLEFLIQDTETIKWSLKHKKTRLIPDVFEFQGWVKNSYQIRSNLSSPIIIEDKVIAVISLNDYKPNAFNDQHIEQMTVLTRQASLAFENARLYADLYGYLLREQQLNEITQIINSSLDLGDILENVVRMTVDLLNADAGFILLQTSEYDGVQNSYSHNFPMEILEKMIEANCYICKVAKSLKNPFLLEDFSERPDITKDFLKKGVKSLLFVPIILAGNSLGVIGLIWYDKKGNTSEKDKNLAEVVAQQAGTAIINARLFENERRRAAEAETMVKVGGIIAASLKQEEMIHQILEQLKMVVPYVTATVQLLREGYLEVIGLSDPVIQANVLGVKFEIPGNNPNTIVVQEKRPVYIEDVQELYGIFGTKANAHIRSWLGVPLVFNNEVIGMLSIDREQKGKFTETDQKMGLAFADQVAIALTNSYLFESEQQKAIEAEALRQAGMALTTTLNRKEIISRILEQLAFVVPYDSATVMMVHGDDFEVVAERGFPEGVTFLGECAHKSEKVPNFIVRETVQPLILKNAPEEFEIFRSEPHVYTISWLGVPIINQNMVVGVLNLDSKQFNWFTEDHARLAKAFADQVAIAMENARLFEEIQHLAITDGLTGMINRRHFFYLAQKEMARVKRYQLSLSLIMLDFDNFKKINDSYGHFIGDQVLQNGIWKIQNLLREVDIVSRYGGEEFVVLLPETGLAYATKTAERIRQQFSELPVSTTAGDIFVTISLGISSTEFEREIDLEVLLERADNALYASKEAGKNKVHTWHLKRNYSYQSFFSSLENMNKLRNDQI